MVRKLMTLGAVCALASAHAHGQSFGDLQASFARNAGTAIVAAQTCPGLSLDGAELEIVGAPLGVTIQELITTMKPQFQEGYEVFVASVDAVGIAQACQDALTAMGPQSDLRILEQAGQ